MEGRRHGRWEAVGTWATTEGKCEVVRLWRQQNAKGNQNTNKYEGYFCFCFPEDQSVESI